MPGALLVLVISDRLEICYMYRLLFYLSFQLYSTPPVFFPTTRPFT